MVPLVAPNGVEVMASDAAAPRLVAAGYKPREQAKPAPRRRTTKAKPKE